MEQCCSLCHFIIHFNTGDNWVDIAGRTGLHCAQTILRRFELESTARPLLAFQSNDSISTG